MEPSVRPGETFPKPVSPDDPLGTYTARACGVECRLELWTGEDGAVGGVLEAEAERLEVRGGFSGQGGAARGYLLEAVAKLPVTTWTMKGSKTRQMGPTAQDFYAAFKLGGGDKGINNTDAQGVALAAIQGLNRKLEAEDQALKARLARLAAEVAGLRDREARLATLERGMVARASR